MSVVVNNAGGPLKGNNGSDGGIVDEQQVDNRRTSASSAKAIVSRRHSMQMDSDSEKLSRRSSAVATGIGCPRLQLTAIQPISAQGIYHMPDTIDRNHGGVWRRGSRAAVFEAFQVHAKVG
uniref:Uncharacterized protein n=1 Tax=Spongospora subterranea TaxID=70186 RepID=A0A0H5R5B2_9EUKA|eukprot:CRZ03334.1 hypothetical protein [Spongospora subterranea]